MKDVGITESDASWQDRFALTPRERSVLALAAEDLSASEIAERLSLSTSTVRTHFANIYAKLQVSTRAGAVAKAMRVGVLS